MKDPFDGPGEETRLGIIGANLPEHEITFRNETSQAP